MALVIMFMRTSSATVKGSFTMRMSRSLLTFCSHRCSTEGDASWWRVCFVDTIPANVSASFDKRLNSDAIKNHLAMQSQRGQTLLWCELSMHVSRDYHQGSGALWLVRTGWLQTQALSKPLSSTDAPSPLRDVITVCISPIRNTRLSKAGAVWSCSFTAFSYNWRSNIISLI